VPLLSLFFSPAIFKPFSLYHFRLCLQSLPWHCHYCVSHPPISRRLAITITFVSNPSILHSAQLICHVFASRPSSHLTICRHATTSLLASTPTFIILCEGGSLCQCTHVSFPPPYLSFCVFRCLSSRSIFYVSCRHLLTSCCCSSRILLPLFSHLTATLLILLPLFSFS
jgi:hypothetical protein